MFTDIGQGKKNMESYEGREKIIFFLGAKPGDKNFLQTNGVFLSLNHVHKSIVFWLTMVLNSRNNVCQPYVVAPIVGHGC
jgi:hypothetical protein